MRDKMYNPKRPERHARFYRDFEEVVRRLHAGETFTDESAAATSYWDYLKGYHPSWRESPLTDRARLQLRAKFFSGVNLYHSIKAEGVRDPLEIHDNAGILCLYKGMRRLTIAYILRIPLIKYDLVWKAGVR